jgi:hypothetical protein
LQNARRHSCFFQNKKGKSETQEESEDQIFHSLLHLLSPPTTSQSVFPVADQRLPETGVWILRGGKLTQGWTEFELKNGILI